MRENDINVVRVVRAVQDTLLTCLKRTEARQLPWNSRSQIVTPTELAKMKKIELKVGNFQLSASETDINYSERPHTQAAHPGVTNKHNSIAYHGVYRLNIRSVDLGRSGGDQKNVLLGIIRTLNSFGIHRFKTFFHLFTGCGEGDGIRKHSAVRTPVILHQHS